MGGWAAIKRRHGPFSATPSCSPGRSGRPAAPKWSPRRSGHELHPPGHRHSVRHSVSHSVVLRHLLTRSFLIPLNFNSLAVVPSFLSSYFHFLVVFSLSVFHFIFSSPSFVPLRFVLSVCLSSHPCHYSFLSPRSSCLSLFTVFVPSLFVVPVIFNSLPPVFLVDRRVVPPSSLIQCPSFRLSLRHLRHL